MVYHTTQLNPVIKLCKCIALARREKVNRPPDPDTLEGYIELMNGYNPEMYFYCRKRRKVVSVWGDEEEIEALAKSLGV